MKIKFNVDEDSGEADWHPETLVKLMNYSPLWRVDVLGDVVGMATQLLEQAMAEMLMEWKETQNDAAEKSEKDEAFH